MRKEIIRYLTTEEVLSGYREVCGLYPFIPSITMWRAWEYAAYKKYKLTEPVLDIGCGDGRFYNLVWPEHSYVVGIDNDPEIIESAKKTGFYKKVYQTCADELPFENNIFSSAFANCSLEHMENLPDVLKSINNCLKKDGILLASVVTEKFLDWIYLPNLFSYLGMNKLALEINESYLRYHNLVNPFETTKWIEKINDAGFEVLEIIPIVPKLFGQLFLLLDNLWHLSDGSINLGAQLEKYLSSYRKFPVAFEKILEGILETEEQSQETCGLVIYAKKISV